MTNESGITPLEYKCVVRVFETDEQSKGGIYIPELVKDRQQQGCISGVFIAKGPIAFTDPDWKVEPKPGDIVLFDKYAGKMITGKDGQKYRIVSDKEIGAIADERLDD